MRNAASTHEVFVDSPRAPNTERPVSQNSLQSGTPTWSIIMRMASFARQDADFIEEQVENEVFDSLDVDFDKKSLPTTSGSNPSLRVALGYWRKQRKLMKTASPGVVDTESRFDAWLEHDEMQLLFKEMALTKELDSWFRFDMFFGAVLCINACAMGLAMENVLTEKHVFVMDIIFLVLFTVEWCVRWYYNKAGFKGMCLDAWTCFDLVILLISYGDTVVSLADGAGAGGSAVPAVRVFRLLRLIRLFRLVRLFEELWVIVSTLVKALRTLIWAMIMFFMLCYIFALIFHTMITFFSVLETPRDVRMWGSVGRCALTLAQIASYSGIDDIRGVYEDHLGEWVLAVFLGFVFISSLCLHNLAVGVLMTYTLNTHSQQGHFASSTARLLEHKALYDLRLRLIEHCHMTLGHSSFSSPFVTREFLCDCCEDEPDRPDRNGPETLSATISAALASWVLPWKLKSESLSTYFKAAAVDSDLIHGIFNEAGRALSAESIMTVDDFIECCNHRVHPLDVHGHHSAYKSFLERLSKIDESISSTTVSLEELSEQMARLLCRYQAVEDEDPFGGILQVDLDKHVATDPGATIPQEAILREKETLIAISLKRKAEEHTAWDNFDFVFSIVVMANAVFIGLELVFGGDRVARSFVSREFDLQAVAWWFVDQAFFVIYVFELSMRVVLHFQIENSEHSDFRVWHYVFPNIAWRMDLQMKLKCLRQFPKYVRNIKNLLLLDTVIVSVSVVDNFILRFIGYSGRALGILRAAGLLRLVRLVRLLHLVKPLAALIKAFTDNMKLTMWCLLVLGLFLYSVSVIIVMLMQIMEDEERSADTEQRWGHLLSSMLSLAQIATCSNWGQRIDELIDLSFWCSLLGMFVYGVANLGILNLVSGIMVQAAYHVVSRHKDKALRNAVDSAKPEVGKMLATGMKHVGMKLQKDTQRVRDHILSARNAVQEHARNCKASEEAVKQAFGMDDSPTVSLFSFSRTQNVNSVVSREVSQEHASSFGLRSMCDTGGYCTIQHVTWCSCNEVALGFHLTRDSLASGPLDDPMLSVLMWEGSRITPTMFLPEASHTGQAVYKNCSNWQFDNSQEEQTAPDEEEWKLKGDLLFTNVPNRVKLRFRFGENYSVVPVVTDCPPALNKQISAKLDDLASMGNGEIAACDLADVLSHDRSLGQCLAGVGLRPEHAMLAFQSIDIANRGRIKVDDFLDCLFRLSKPCWSIDVAASKTFLTKFNEDLRPIVALAQSESHCISSVVQRLRGVGVVEVIDAENTEAVSEQDLGITIDPLLFCQNEIQALKRRVARLRESISTRKVILGAADCEGLEVPPSAGPGEDSDSMSSVTSAHPGWD